MVYMLTKQNIIKFNYFDCLKINKREHRINILHYISSLIILFYFILNLSCLVVPRISKLLNQIYFPLCYIIKTYVFRKKKYQNLCLSIELTIIFKF